MASPREQAPRLNNRIRVREVRVIQDGGDQLGVMPTSEALQLAADAGMDLVEVSPNAQPPVCKIMDYGKYKYQQSKKTQQAKKNQQQTQLKEIKFRPKTDEHDYQTKMRKIRKFLEGGDRVKATIFFRGREIVHKDRGLTILERVMEETTDIAKVDQRPQHEGRTMNILLAPIAKKE